MDPRIDGPGPDRESTELAPCERDAFDLIVDCECFPDLRQQLSRALRDIKRSPGSTVISWFLSRAKEVWRPC